MNDVELDPTFSNAFRSAFIEEVSRRKRTRLHRIWLGAACAGILTATGAGGIATATLNAPPGAAVYEQVGDRVSEKFTGDGTVQLGAPPAGANSISFTVTCLSDGGLQLDGYGGIPCESGSQTRTGAVPLTLSQQSVLSIVAEPGTEWSIDAAYSKKVVTDFGINASGQTFGTVGGSTTGEEPDLIAATAMNCKRGYISRKDEAEAIPMSYSSWEEVDEYMAGEVFEDKYIPVYESDGKTIIGEFLIAGQPRPGEGLTPGPQC